MIAFIFSENIDSDGMIYLATLPDLMGVEFPSLNQIFRIINISIFNLLLISLIVNNSMNAEVGNLF